VKKKKPDASSRGSKKREKINSGKGVPSFWRRKKKANWGGEGNGGGAHKSSSERRESGAVGAVGKKTLVRKGVVGNFVICGWGKKAGQCRALHPHGKV